MIIGSSGAGKTTLAREVARRTGLPHVELDALHWQSGWVQAEREVFRRRVADALRGDAWVVDGNYSVARDLVWARAEVLVWLDYRLSLSMWRLLRRTLRRTVTRETLWNGNRERFRAQFFTRDSLFVWALTTHRRRQQTVTRELADPAHAHLRALRFRSPGAARRWLATLTPDTTGGPPASVSITMA